MIAALVWKEYREQRIVWAALAFVGAATLFGLPAVMAPGGLDDQPDVPRPWSCWPSFWWPGPTA